MFHRCKGRSTDTRTMANPTTVVGAAGAAGSLLALAAAAALLLSPPAVLADSQEGAPACPCGASCPESDCAATMRAGEIGMYPWVAEALIYGYGSVFGSEENWIIYSQFLESQSTQEYEFLGEEIGSDTGLVLTSEIIDAAYNGLSGLSVRHLYEVEILKWLQHEGAPSSPFELPDELVGLVADAYEVVADASSATDEAGRALYAAAEAWTGLTGDATLLNSARAGSLPTSPALGAALGVGTWAAGGIERAVDAWSLFQATSIEGAGGPSLQACKLVLLKAARDACVGYDDDFVAAADSVIAACEGEGARLAATQASAATIDIASSGLVAICAAANPLLSLGTGAIGIAAADSAQKNVSMLATYWMGLCLERGLDAAYESARLSYDRGGAVGGAEAAGFVRGFEAFLEYRVYALDEAASWAESALSSRDKKDAFIAQCTNQSNTALSYINLITKTCEMFADVAERAFSDGCICETQGAQDGGDEALYAAYAGLVDSYISKYGAQSFTNIYPNSSPASYYMSGLCYIGLRDFNSDGVSELVLVYGDPGLRKYGQLWDPYVTDIWSYKDGSLSCAMHTEDANFGDGGSCTLGFCTFEGKPYLVTGAADSFDYRCFYAFDGSLFELAAVYERPDVISGTPSYVNGVEVADGSVTDPLVAAYLSGEGISFEYWPMNYIPESSSAYRPGVGELTMEYQEAYRTIHNGGQPGEPEYVVLGDGSAAPLKDAWGFVGDKDGRVATVAFEGGGASWQMDGIVRTDSAGDTYVRFGATVDGAPCEVAWYGGDKLFDCDAGYQVVPAGTPGTFEHPAGVALVPWSVSSTPVEGGATSFVISDNPASPFRSTTINGEWYVDGDGLWCVRFWTYRGTDLYAYEDVDDQGYRAYTFWTYWGEPVYRVEEPDLSVPDQPSYWRHAYTGECL